MALSRRLVLIVSGLPYSGKSWIVDRLSDEEALRGAVLLSQDKVRVGLYGERADADISKTEHLFKNEWLRYELLRELVLGTNKILVDSVLLTRVGHQVPMLETIARAGRCVNAIAQEHGRDEVIIQAKIIMCYASPDVLKQRRLGPHDERTRTLGPRFTLQGLRAAYEQFEFPDSYEPLYLDTSDESENAARANLRNILAFIEGDYDVQANAARSAQAMESHRLIREEIRSA